MIELVHRTHQGSLARRSVPAHGSPTTCQPNEQLQLNVNDLKIMLADKEIALTVANTRIQQVVTLIQQKDERIGVLEEKLDLLDADWRKDDKSKKD